jgi:hypothetical protein
MENMGLINKLDLVVTGPEGVPEHPGIDSFTKSSETPETVDPPEPDSTSLGLLSGGAVTPASN